MTVHAQPDVTARMAVIRLVAVIRHVTRPDSTDSVELMLVCLRWDFYILFNQIKLKYSTRVMVLIILHVLSKYCVVLKLIY